MLDHTMKGLQESSYLFGGNASYLEELYDAFLKDPNSVETHWRDYFSHLPLHYAGSDISHTDVRDYFTRLAKQEGRTTIAGTTSDAILERKQAQVTELIDAYRLYGHYHAKLDPLSLAPPRHTPMLELNYYGLSESDLNTVFDADGIVGLSRATLNEIDALLNATYCGSLGFEYMYASDANEVRWMQERIESVRAQPKFSAEAQKHILQLLTAAEGLEKYLGNKYVGQKRFSLEGGETLIPLLDQLIQGATRAGTEEIVIGMAHRGRLNVLINILGKEPEELFRQFEGRYTNVSRSGDVKYHLGFSSDVQTAAGKIHLSLAFNPSHLEIVAPVVEGAVRARQDRLEDQEKKLVVPVQIHGDSAFAGQGVVMETFSLSQTRGYGVGGSIHIVINNQVGFTTSNPHDTRSSYYCTDIAKMVEAPVIHVNGDDPEAVVFAAQLAIDYRMTFKRDIVIDLVCYRRHGHNEADEPAATQPVMYHKIKNLPGVRKQYADQLIASGIYTEPEVEKLVLDYRDAMDKGEVVVNVLPEGQADKRLFSDWKPYLDQDWTAAARTALNLKQLKQLSQALEKLPEGFTLQAQVSRMMEERRKMFAGEIPLNWGTAETLAYASLLVEGYPVRLSGQDSGRGTFAHRHAVLYNQVDGKAYIPLAHLDKKQAQFTVIDSILSEEAVMAFEYGYATSDPKTLVIWEAQYGDFANGAQVVIDQFLSSGEQKWNRLCGLVLLLPHGYEGSGPEHSSARLERYLQLCAQHNIQVCVPTTPAQIFHLLRRQLLRPFRAPLIVMSPKNMLRHKLAISTLSELAEGEFQVIITEVDDIKPADVRRVILCCGKVYYDLLEERRKKKQFNIAIIRIEQLYPFPEAVLQKELQRYKKAQDIVWCQEEPKNQGVWYQVKHRLSDCLTKDQTLQYVGRAESASPAAGYASLHHEQQITLIKEALTLSSY